MLKLQITVETDRPMTENKKSYRIDRDITVFEVEYRIISEKGGL